MTPKPSLGHRPATTRAAPRTESANRRADHRGRHQASRLQLSTLSEWTISGSAGRDCRLTTGAVARRRVRRLARSPVGRNASARFGAARPRGRSRPRRQSQTEYEQRDWSRPGRRARRCRRGSAASSAPRWRSASARACRCGSCGASIPEAWPARSELLRPKVRLGRRATSARRGHCPRTPAGRHRAHTRGLRVSCISRRRRRECGARPGRPRCDRNGP
jgi:hypothetical protein